MSKVTIYLDEINNTTITDTNIETITYIINDGCCSDECENLLCETSTSLPFQYI